MSQGSLEHFGEASREQPSSPPSAESPPLTSGSAPPRTHQATPSSSPRT
jgi:hypothetical protein